MTKDKLKVFMTKDKLKVLLELLEDCSLESATCVDDEESEAHDLVFSFYCQLSDMSEELENFINTL